MIAHFDKEIRRIVIKCSPFYQFDGYWDQDDATRPRDFDTVKDLFFRWLNPVCRGDTGKDVLSRSDPD